MTEFIHLVGAEEVARAGSRMASAAEDMLRAANMISEANDRFLRQFEELINRMEGPKTIAELTREFDDKIEEIFNTKGKDHG